MSPAVYCAYKKLVPIEQLVPHPRNPNTHPEEQIMLLAKIIEQQGWRAPVTVSVRSGYITRGHARLAAAKRIGAAVVPVDYQEYDSEASELADMVADNRIAELAEMSEQKVKSIVADLKEANFDIELTGYAEFEIGGFGKADEEQDGPEVEFTQELMEAHNYVVLYFDNDVDWLQLQTLFPLKTVKALDSEEGFTKQGVGRVVRGADFLNAIMGAKRAD